jgi:putative transcriptional regulator
MNMRGQHLSDAWYLDHANGNLSLAERVFMDAHIELNPRGAEKINAYEAICGKMLADMDVRPQDLELLDFDADDVLMRDPDMIERTDRSATKLDPSASAQEHPFLPNALAHYIDSNALSIDWKFLGPKLRKCLLWESENGTKLWMLKAEGGAVIPSHTHRGSELTLVLQGSFHDQSHRFSRGDVQEADENTHHDIIIDEGETCVCLAITQAPLMFANPALRLFQVFTGI